MVSKLHQPITEEPDEQTSNDQGGDSRRNTQSEYSSTNRYSYGGYNQQAAEYPPTTGPSQFSKQDREMPMPIPYLGEATSRSHADNPDAELSSTVGDLFEDHAPSAQQRTWNGEPLQNQPHDQDQDQEQAYRSQQAGMREPMLPDGDDMYTPAPPIGPSAAGGLGRQSQTVECPWCHAVVSTRVKRKIGAKAGGAAALVAFIAWPLFWVPLLIPGLQRKTHYCPSCNRKIGRGRRNV
ncbi:hypothetical protein GGI19_004231 [Coemansia pectinata]|uniref:LITAF domain-containing protein n=1 Tax=Coemansia pectinata TaxID=1052879 RepID=A0A9W8GS49_9FUNG|nr:hypothetical protein GGI19_004231 [Coemansia pectinata]